MFFPRNTAFTVYKKRDSITQQHTHFEGDGVKTPKKERKLYKLNLTSYIVYNCNFSKYR